MATVSSLVETHRRGQLRIRARFMRELLRMWPLIDPTRLDERSFSWINAVIDLIWVFRQESAQRSLRYYNALRALEIGEPLPDLVVPDQLVDRDRRAMQVSLFTTGPVAYTKRIRKPGVLPEKALELTEAGMMGAASRHVLNGGRRLVADAMVADPQVTRYARVTGPNPCAFCAMLASRGPVYLSELSAKRTTGRSARGAGEKYHDNCQCSSRPMFEGGPDDDGWTDQAREWDELWAESTRGWSGKNALNAFRTAYEAQRKQRASE